MSAAPPSDDDFDGDFEAGADLRRGREIPEDLADLMWAIAEEANVRMFDPAAPPYRFERFEAYDALVGGMGMVIEARDPELDRKVAIKLWMSTGPEAEAALLAEAKTLAKLAHPHVVAVHETGTWGERVYFVMEWVEGVDGQVWMSEARSWQEVRAVFIEAGKGLAAAHDAGIQHRDFKPANMLIGDDGRVRVADFGVADSLRAVEERGEGPTRIVGTPSYMAPERLRGEHGDARSDQFSFCVAMWRALHGRRPYAGDTGDELLEAIERGAIRPGDPKADVPHWLSRVVRKGLEPDPDNRHVSMHELLQALEQGPAAGGRPHGGPARSSTDPAPFGHDSRSETEGPGWKFFLYGVTVTAMVLLLVSLGRRLVRPATPDEGSDDQASADSQGTTGRPASGPDPARAILEQVEAGQFKDAHSAWLEARASEDRPLTDAESLKIGRACLERAKELAAFDPRSADQATLLAAGIATSLETLGESVETRAAGTALREDLVRFKTEQRSSDD